MASFEGRAAVTISVWADVQAETREDALAQLGELVMPSLCHQCADAGQDDDESWALTGELDGEPFEIRLFDEAAPDSMREAIDRAVATERARCLGFVRDVGAFYSDRIASSNLVAKLILDDLEKAISELGGDCV